MKKMVMIFLLFLAPMAHAGDPQERDGAVLPHFQEIEKQLVDQGLQQQEATAMIQAMNRAHFSEEQMVRVVNQLSAGDTQEITAGAVREKIYEGIAKGISPETILQATARVRSRFEFAMNLAGQLDKKNQAQLGRTVADSLSAGLTEEDARSIAASLQARTQNNGADASSPALRMETMYTARDLARQGVTSATTTEMLDAALVQGYDVEAMRTLRTSLRNTENENIEGITRKFASAIAHGVKAGDLRGSDNSLKGNRASTGEPNGREDSGSGNGAGADSSGGGRGGNGGGGGGNGGGGGGNGGR